MSKSQNTRILIIPSVKDGNGSGHLRRSIRLLKELKSIGISSSAVFLEKKYFKKAETISRAEECSDANFIDSPNPSDWTFCVFDCRNTPKELFKIFFNKSITIGIDEGGSLRKSFDYLIDSLPNIETTLPNIASLGFLKLPCNRKEKIPSGFNKKILLAFGGEDKANLSGRLLEKIKEHSLFPLANIGLVKGPLFENREYPATVKILESPNNLMNDFANWDIVFTSFGISCFEALYSRTPVILFNPSEYHKKLSIKAEIPEVGVLNPNIDEIKKLIAKPELLLPAVKRYSEIEEQNLAKFITSLEPSKTKCRGCGKPHNEILFRNKEASFFKCSDCGLVNRICFTNKNIVYNKDYFFEDYKKQYGKTYLEDFNQIKKAGKERCNTIKKFVKEGNLLDIGCGYGPFLSAANDEGFKVFGIDASTNAASWVSAELGFPARAIPIERFYPEIHGIEYFDVISMWFVIEHLESLPEVLKKVNKMLRLGGVFCASTPAFSGISCKRSMTTFLEASPPDHYTVWDPVSAKELLKRNGFAVKLIKCPVIHPDRFFKPGIYNKLPLFLKKLCGFFIEKTGKLLKMGDTFEFYAVKTGNGANK